MSVAKVLDQMPARNSVWGFGTYYLNLLVLIILSVNAWLRPEPLTITAVVLALGLLLLQDIVWYRRCQFSHQDRTLIEKLTAQLDEPSLQEILTECDFCQWSFSIFTLDPLQEIDREWIGVDYEFSHPAYQQLFVRFKEKLHEFLTLVNSHGKNYNAGMYYLYARKGNPGDTNYGPLANQLMADVYQDYQAFRKIYIAKMPYIQK